MRIILSIILTLTLSGCASVHHRTGTPINMDSIQSIVKGATTEAKILEMFGSPQTRSIGGFGTTYVFLFQDINSSGTLGAVTTDMQQQILSVIINDGVVTSYTYTETMPNKSTMTY